MGWRLFGLRFALAILATLAMGVGAASAATSLVLAPAAGQPGATFDAIYTFSPAPRATCPSNGLVDFWWDAAGPDPSNPPGAALLGTASLVTSGCMARAQLLVPITAGCAAHTVYGFIDDGRGNPVAGSTVSAIIAVGGCASPSPLPTPAPTATPGPPSPSPTTSLVPSASPGASPSGSATTIPTSSPTPTLSPIMTMTPAGSPPARPSPTAGALFPPLGAAPTFPEDGSGQSPLGILVLLGAGALLGGWAAVYFGASKASSASAARAATVKWGWLALALLLTGGSAASAGAKTGMILSLTVPNSQFPTIQAAIDAAPPGANIHIKPGTYHESLFVDKQLQIYGSEDEDGVTLAGPLLQAVDPAGNALGILNYEDHGGGWLQHVRIEGSHAGVMGLNGDPSAILEISDLEVVGSGIGILWDSAAALTVRDSSILDSTSDEFGVLFEGGIGIYIANADVHLSNVDVGTVDISKNPSVGIYVRQSQVKVDDGLIYGSNVAGIWAVDSTLSVHATALWGNHADPADGSFGDGIAVLLGSAELTAIQTVGNERCGVSSFGAIIQVADNSFLDNAFHVCGEPLAPSTLAPGLPGQEAGFEYVDLGGNYCGSDEVKVVCQVTSPGLEPPEPIPPSG